MRRVVFKTVVSLSSFQLSEGTCFLPTEVEPVNTPDGPITPVPVGIRPVMRKHRIEVMNCFRSTWTLELTNGQNIG